MEWNIRSEKRILLLLYPTTHLSRVSYRDVWIGRGCQSNHWIAIFSSAFGRHVVSTLLYSWHLLKRLLRLPILLSVTTTTCLPIGLQLSIFIETKKRHERRRIRTAKTNSFEDFRHRSTANGGKWKMKRHFLPPKMIVGFDVCAHSYIILAKYDNLPASVDEIMIELSP